MTLAIYIAAAAVASFFLYRLLFGTDTPHIKGLPEVRGLPLFGSLYELGEEHAKVAQGWAKKYGPVFQVRMGNRVRRSHLIPCFMFTQERSRSNHDPSELSLQTPSTQSATSGSHTSPP
jgi:hypothetical protein